MSKNTITYIIIAILLIVGGYWAYGMFSGGGETATTGGVTVTGGGSQGPVDEATAQANQFIQILQNVSQVNLSDLSLLTSPIFQTGLQDFGKPLEDRPVGRPNPFAPVTGLDFIPAKGSVATSTPKTTGPATTTPGPLGE
ncbi:MAG: hypothetical protein WCV68_04075 [Candidatus Paceibacterota bacterium]|jgi:hypothetical protein